MNTKNFTIPGYARFYRSLLHFDRNMQDSEAVELTYTLYTAVLASYRYKKPDADITELAQSEFYGKLMKSEQRPYKTIIQLYRAMEAIYQNCTLIDAISIPQLRGVMKLSGMMDDMEIRFRRLFNMNIDDKRTVFSICARSLIPRSDEPGLCLLQDWLEATTA